MKTKNKSATQIYATKVTSKRVTTSLVDPKIKQKLINTKFSKLNKKGDKKQIKIQDKQNNQSTNVPSPQNALRGKNYRPILKKSTRLELSHNTVSVTINQQNGSGNKKDLLQSLLYGDIEISYRNDLNIKQQDADQLLIGCTEKSHHIKIYKNLSPIKSISEYSVTQNQNNIFVAQKIDNPTANILIKINNNQNIDKNFKNIQCIVLRRLLVHFNQKQQGLLNFYCTIHKVLTKKQLKIKIRQYLFQNSIIFNKIQLQQLMQVIYKIISQIKINTHRKKQYKQYKQDKQDIQQIQQICQQKIQIIIRQLFLYIDPINQGLTNYLWVNQQILQRLFYQKDMVCIWYLVQQICNNSVKQIQSSFRQSRFCLELTSSQFIHQVDQKRRKQNLQILCKWLSNFIKLSSLNSKLSNTINIKQ